MNTFSTRLAFSLPRTSILHISKIQQMLTVNHFMTYLIFLSFTIFYNCHNLTPLESMTTETWLRSVYSTHSRAEHTVDHSHETSTLQ